MMTFSRASSRSTGSAPKEEKRGIIRWLRPSIQTAHVKVAVQEGAVGGGAGSAEAELPTLPTDDAELVAALRRMLRVIGKPMEPKALARQFRDGGRPSDGSSGGLRLLVAAGHRASLGLRLVPADGSRRIGSRNAPRSPTVPIDLVA